MQDDKQVLGCLEDKTHQSTLHCALSRVCTPGGVKFLSGCGEGVGMMNFSSTRFEPEQILWRLGGVRADGDAQCCGTPVVLAVFAKQKLACLS